MTEYNHDHLPGEFCTAYDCPEIGGVMKLVKAEVGKNLNTRFLIFI